MLVHLIRFVRRRPPLSPATTSLASPLGHRSSAATPAANYTDMAQNDPKDPSSEDSETHPFGEAYSTRSNDEGFGGIYGGNQDPHDLDQDHNDEKLPKKEEEAETAGEDFDKNQGSHVAEKEKARGQK